MYKYDLYLKTPFHHLSGLNQSLWKWDSAIQFPESSQFVLHRPAAKEAETSSPDTRIAPVRKMNSPVSLHFLSSILPENITSLSRKTFSVLKRVLFILMNGKK